MVKYKRIVLKISGEALAGDAGFGIQPPVIGKIAKEIKAVHDLGVQVASFVVVVTCGAVKLVPRWALSGHRLITSACSARS